MSGLEKLGFWRDPVPRNGPENMAVDSWLLGQESPVLRAYCWEGSWGSLGYFGELEEAQAVLPGVSLVRRATGGGLVDHRKDLTYTLAIPRSHGLARTKGSESYRLIHSALADSLRAGGHEIELVRQDHDVDSSSCFEKPVEWDLIDQYGNKIAGAGQRRTRKGLLHQGSILLGEPTDDAAILMGLASELSLSVKVLELNPSGEGFTALVSQFSEPAWLSRR